MISNAPVDVPLNRDAAALVHRARDIAAQRRGLQPTSTDLLHAMLEMQPGLIPNGPSVAAGISADGNDATSLPLARILINANREAQSLGHYQVGPTHLLLAMLYSDSPSTAAPLQHAGLTLFDVRQKLQGLVAAGEQTYRRRMPSTRGVLGISPVFLGLVAVAGASGAWLWRLGVDGGPLAVPLTLVFVVAGWIVSLCIHEFGHAIVAYLGGDRAVAEAGYLTLNPLRYTNATMSLVLPVIFLLIGGIAMPGGAVYINHSVLRSKTWSSAVSLAGPFGTFICWLVIAAAFTVSIRYNLITDGNIFFFGALAALGFYMTFAVIINLVPVPGLDGFGIIRPWLPYPWQYSAMRYGTIAIFGVYAALWFVAPVRSAFFGLILSLTTQVNIPIELISFGLHNLRML